MRPKSQRTALAGRPAMHHSSPLARRDAAASFGAVPRKRPRRLSVVLDVLAFLTAGGDEGHAAVRYSR